MNDQKNVEMKRLLKDFTVLETIHDTNSPKKNINKLTNLHAKARKLYFGRMFLEFGCTDIEVVRFQ